MSGAATEYPQMPVTGGPVGKENRGGAEGRFDFLMEESTLPSVLLAGLLGWVASHQGGLSQPHPVLARVSTGRRLVRRSQNANSHRSGAHDVHYLDRHSQFAS